MKQKIIFCTTRPPFPVLDGTRERIIHELSVIAQTHVVDLWIIGNEKISAENREKLKKICGGDVVSFHLGKIQCYWRSLLALFTSLPLQSLYFFSSKVSSELNKKSKECQIIFLHTIRFGEYAKKLIKYQKDNENKIILHFNDAISLNYHEASTKARGIWRLIYRLEERRVSDYENEMLLSLKTFLIVSNQDAEYLKENYLKKYHQKLLKDIHILRHSTEDRLLKYQYQGEEKNLVFIGNLFYPPNRQGLKFFCEAILPTLIKKQPGCQLLIIGRGGEYFKKYPGTKVLGFVDDPYELISRQSVFVNPVNFGAGVSTKSLLAMSLGIPIIANKIGMSGIEGSKSGDNYIEIDYKEPARSAEIISELISDFQKRQEIGTSGKNIIDQLYRRSQNDSKITKLIDSLLTSDDKSDIKTKP